MVTIRIEDVTLREFKKQLMEEKKALLAWIKAFPETDCEWFDLWYDRVDGLIKLCNATQKQVKKDFM